MNSALVSLFFFVVFRLINFMFVLKSICSIDRVSGLVLVQSNSELIRNKDTHKELMIASIDQWCQTHGEKNTPWIMCIINIGDKVLIASCWTYRHSENYVFCCQSVFSIQCSVNCSGSASSYCLLFSLSNMDLVHKFRYEH